MKLKGLSPILFVDAIEPSLPFWTERLGFEQHAEAKNDAGDLQFVLLLKDGVTVMLQSVASLEEDLPMLTEHDRATSTCLYLQVEKLDEVIAALGDHPVLLPRRTTFYGRDEIGVRGPAGNVVIFAQ